MPNDVIVVSLMMAAFVAFAPYCIGPTTARAA